MMVGARLRPLSYSGVFGTWGGAVRQAPARAHVVVLCVSTKDYRCPVFGIGFACFLPVGHSHPFRFKPKVLK
jgi:hypothetical protein